MYIKGLNLKLLQEPHCDDARATLWR